MALPNQTSFLTLLNLVLFRLFGGVGWLENLLCSRILTYASTKPNLIFNPIEPCFILGCLAVLGGWKIYRVAESFAYASTNSNLF